MDRAALFETIIGSSLPACRYSDGASCVLEGDSLALLQALPDHCVAMILADPPFPPRLGNPADLAAQDALTLEWLQAYAVEWKRVLKPNGSLFCFSPAALSARLEILLSEHFNVLSQIVWTKPDAPELSAQKQRMEKKPPRQWISASERILFMEPAAEGNPARSFLSEVLKAARKELQLTTNELAELTESYSKINHGGNISNWETGRTVPTKEQYEKLCEAFRRSGRKEKMPDYDDVIRPFHVRSVAELSDVWHFDSVPPYYGRHPAEKPIDLLEHAILATTDRGDIVLDCFAGSGSTAVAALKHGRRSVSIELEEAWVLQIEQLLTSLHGLEPAAYPNNRDTSLAEIGSGQLKIQF